MGGGEKKRKNLVLINTLRLENKPALIKTLANISCRQSFSPPAMRYPFTWTWFVFEMVLQIIINSTRDNLDASIHSSGNSCYLQTIFFVKINLKNIYHISKYFD